MQLDMDTPLADMCESGYNEDAEIPGAGDAGASQQSTGMVLAFILLNASPAVCLSSGKVHRYRALVKIAVGASAFSFVHRARFSKAALPPRTHCSILPGAVPSSASATVNCTPSFDGELPALAVIEVPGQSHSGLFQRMVASVEPSCHDP